MNNTLNTLGGLLIGQKARVEGLLAKGKERRRMLDLGIVNGTTIEALQKVRRATLLLILYGVR